MYNYNEMFGLELWKYVAIMASNFFQYLFVSSWYSFSNPIQKWAQFHSIELLKETQCLRSVELIFEKHGRPFCGVKILTDSVRSRRKNTFKISF